MKELFKIKNLIQSIFDQVRIENDVEKLIGKQVIYRRRNHPYDGMVCVVGAIAENVGLTIVSKDNPNMNIVCYVGPKSGELTSPDFKDGFWFSVKEIRRGIFDTDKLVNQDFFKKVYDFNSDGVMGKCAFSGK